MINRSEAIRLLYRYIHENYLIEHAFAVESIMISLAQILEKNKTLWGIVGLLHDLDFEYTKGNPVYRFHDTPPLFLPPWDRVKRSSNQT